MIRVLFVCLGNICRSPSAEAVFRHRLEAAGLDDRAEADSAGTAAWHTGKPADPRAVAAAEDRGVVITGVARQVDPVDFERFDLILAMDAANRTNLLALPGADPARVRLMREFGGEPDADVPDPYYGEDDGFGEVLDLLERCCDGLIAEIRSGGLVPTSGP